MMTGQTSQVWEVVETSSGRHFALKLLLPENTRSPEHRRFLFHEGEVGLQLHHQNIIRVLRLVRDRVNPYIVMEFFPSTNLKLRLMRKNPLVQEKAYEIIEQTAKGLAAMHDHGWIHRDVKPDNILVNSSGEVRIIDFALAQRIRKGSLLSWLFRSRSTMGTRSYMSPEQIRGEPLDERADLYSFGITMYELLTGRPPFRGLNPGDLLHRHLTEIPQSPRVLNPEVTEECANLILRMLAKKKTDRPRDFHEFLAAFRNMRVFKTAPAETKRSQE
ncbi:MAG: serine/threonine protein kinase [Gemmataceae bacterium]